MNTLGYLGRIVFAFSLLLSSQAIAQGAQVPFKGMEIGPNSTVEVTADSLSIDQNTGLAVFTGNVIVGLDEMRLTGNRVEVVYSGQTGGGTAPVSMLRASGNVVFTNGTEAAEAENAEFDLEAGLVTMGGNVILTQGQNVLSGQKLRINLNSGTAVIEGRVQTILQAGGN